MLIFCQIFAVWMVAVQGLQHFHFKSLQNPFSGVAFSSRKSHLSCRCNVST